MDTLYIKIVNSLVNIYLIPAEEIYENAIKLLIDKNNEITKSSIRAFYFDGSLYRNKGIQVKIHEAPELDSSLIEEFNSIIGSYNEATEYSELLKRELFEKEMEYESYYKASFLKDADYSKSLWAIKNFLPKGLFDFAPDNVKYYRTTIMIDLHKLKIEDWKSGIELSPKASEALSYLIGLQVLL